MVTQEVLKPANKLVDGTNNASVNEIYVSLEDLFLHTLAELEGSVGYLMNDQYASHVLRVLLLVLAGEPLDTEATKQVLQSKRKETVVVGGDQNDDSKKSRIVPKAFQEALAKLLAESVAGLDTAKLRALATHPIANPTFQLLLRLELTHFGKQRAKEDNSIIRKLLPDDPITGDCGSAAFISGLIYDQVGSHLVEQVVQYAPGKMFKSLYREFFNERLASLARNEIAGYVVCRTLERLSKDDLFEAHEKLIPVLPNLLERNRTVVVRTLIERCVKRDIDTQVIAAQIDAAVVNEHGFDVQKFLKLDETAGNGQNTTEPAKLHFNYLAQAMLMVPGPLSALILNSVADLEPSTLLRLAKDQITCHTIQHVLKSSNASIIQKRKIIQQWYGHIGEMALDRNASHVVDCIWEGTHGLAFIRERIAEELAENEGALRESQYGRSVWRNWKMDLYKRRRQDWIKQSKVKASNDGFQSFAEIDQNKKGDAPRKTAIELARERHAKKKAAKEAKDKEKGATAGSSRTTGSAGRRPPSSTVRTAAATPAAAAAASG
jgi:nucleolar protein 9